MNNFYLVARGIDVVPLMLQLHEHSYLWDQNNLRTTHPESPHTQVNDIWLRFNDLTPYQENPLAAADEHESIWYPAANILTAARPIIFALMNTMQGERLGRCLITKLAPGKKIDRHDDGGSHAAYYERMHVVLQGLPGSLFECEGERVNMQTGEVWWFNNAGQHEVINNSADDRIHMIVDIKVTR